MWRGICGGASISWVCPHFLFHLSKPCLLLINHSLKMSLEQVTESTHDDDTGPLGEFLSKLPETMHGDCDLNLPMARFKTGCSSKEVIEGEHTLNTFCWVNLIMSTVLGYSCLIVAHFLSRTMCEGGTVASSISVTRGL